MSDQHDDAYGLLLAFDSDEPLFTRGVEVGMVWTRLEETDERQFTVHTTNAEMMLRIAESLGLYVVSKDVDDTWMEVEFSDEPASREGVNNDG